MVKLRLGHDQEEPTHLYVLACAGHTKVGIAADVTDRVKHLQFCSPLKIEVVVTRLFLTRREARAAERMLHEKYDHTRTWGEWFNISADGIAAEVAAQYVDATPPPRDRRPSYIEHIEIETPVSRAPRETGGVSMERMREVAKTLEF